MTTQKNLLKTIRIIELEDYTRGYEQLFSTLSHCNPLSKDEFKNIIKERNTQGWHTWVLEDSVEGKKIIIATISLMIERKFYRDGKSVAHIEDVIVLPAYQHHKLGQHLVEFAINKAKQLKCYKVILDCKKSLEQFYSKSGLKVSNIQMAMYF